MYYFPKKISGAFSWGKISFFSSENFTREWTMNGWKLWISDGEVRGCARTECLSSRFVFFPSTEMLMPEGGGARRFFFNANVVFRCKIYFLLKIKRKKGMLECPRKVPGNFKIRILFFPAKFRESST